MPKTTKQNKNRTNYVLSDFLFIPGVTMGIASCSSVETEGLVQYSFNQKPTVDVITSYILIYKPAWT